METLNYYRIFDIQRLTKLKYFTINKYIVKYFPELKSVKRKKLTQEQYDFMMQKYRDDIRKKIEKKKRKKNDERYKSYSKISNNYTLDDLFIENGARSELTFRRFRNNYDYKILLKMIDEGLNRNDTEKVTKAKNIIQALKEKIKRRKKYYDTNVDDEVIEVLKMEKIFYPDHYVVIITFADSMQKWIYLNQHQNITKTEIIDLKKRTKTQDIHMKNSITNEHQMTSNCNAGSLILK